jgi:hypothetical protein
MCLLTFSYCTPVHVPLAPTIPTLSHYPNTLRHLVPDVAQRLGVFRLNLLNLLIMLTVLRSQGALRCLAASLGQ